MQRHTETTPPPTADTSSTADTSVGPSTAEAVSVVVARAAEATTPAEMGEWGAVKMAVAAALPATLHDPGRCVRYGTESSAPDELRRMVAGAKWVVVNFTPRKPATPTASEAAKMADLAVIATWAGVGPESDRAAAPSSPSSSRLALAIVAPMGSEVPVVWRKWPALGRFSPVKPIRTAWGEAVAEAMRKITGTTPPVVPMPEIGARSIPPVVAVIVPRSSVSPVWELAQAAAEELGLLPGVVVPVVPESNWAEAVTTLARASLVIADFATDFAHSAAEVATLATVARDYLGHADTLRLVTTAARLPDTWAAESAVFVDELAPHFANADDVALRDAIADWMAPVLGVPALSGSSSRITLRLDVPDESVAGPPLSSTADGPAVPFPAALEPFRRGPRSLLIRQPVTVPVGECWVIPAGTRIDLQAGADWRCEGELRVQGTATEPVIFAGDGWGHIEIVGRHARGSFSWTTIAGGYGDDGAGILVRNGAALVATHCTFRRNRANRHGGGVCVIGTDAHPCDEVVLEHCRFEKNTAHSGGGANFNAFSRSRLIGCTFVGNHAKGFGGALTVRGDQHRPSTAECVECRFEKNSAVNGGAVNINFYAEAHITFSGFYRNEAKDNGGALIVLGQADRASRLTAEASHFVENNANNGGAVNFSVYSTGELRDCVWLQNMARHWGGGLSAYGHADAPTTVRLAGARFTANRAGSAEAPDAGHGPHATITHAITNDAGAITNGDVDRA